MSIVVGVAPGHSASAPVHLGVLLARSYRQELVVVSICASTWPPRIGRRDAAVQEALVAGADAVLDEARALVPADLTATYETRTASSARRGLLDAAAAHGAVRLVVGAAGVAVEGVIAVGSVSTGLLQSADVPVAIAPHGFTAGPKDRLERVTAAYSGSETSAELVLGAAAVAADAGADFRVASFATRPQAVTEAAIGFTVEEDVIDEWAEVIRAHTEEILADIAEFAERPRSVDVVVGAGDTWADAISAVGWRAAEVLLVGSSSLGPLARISLGSHAMKIVRHAPVPVVLVPRRAAEAYAARAGTQ
ncbi:universal stress protein [Leucobacter tardus]|uniref:Universal stress protein n=1 Tax=Leucobacter tardus TaxID=501483 RepID=A0A939QHR9_9MICO|nr:universal stress protein [Leucobacter tardus]MBO2990308.1 universal stress protein [Leucobacter tardus]